MLSQNKIEIYKSYKGYYDGYYFQNKDRGRIVTDEDWFYLDSLMQDLFIIRKGLASKTFQESVLERLRVSCDTEQTVLLIIELEVSCMAV